MVLDSVTMGEKSLVMEGSNDAIVAEKRQSIGNEGVAFHECSFVEKAEHSDRASQGWWCKIEIQESRCIRDAHLVQKPSLHLVQPLELTCRCEQNGTAGVFNVAPNMSLELVDQRRVGIEMPQSEHGSDFGTNLGQCLINAWLHCHSAVYQSSKQFEVVSLTT